MSYESLVLDVADQNDYRFVTKFKSGTYLFTHRRRESTVKITADEIALVVGSRGDYGFIEWLNKKFSEQV